MIPRRILRLNDALPSLAVAPLAGVAVLTFLMLLAAANTRLQPRLGTLSPADQPSTVLLVPYLALWIAPFCYGATVLFALPVLIMWPASRRPTYPVAVAWGTVAAWAAFAVVSWGDNLRPTVGQILTEMLNMAGLALYGGAGAATGLVYARLSRRRAARHDSN